MTLAPLIDTVIARFVFLSFSAGGLSSSEQRASHFFRSTLTPFVTRLANADARSYCPCFLPTDASTAMAVNSLSSRIALTSPVRVLPGPTSTKVLNPSAYSFSTCSTNLTGAANWFANNCFAASASVG